jgi:arsenate reductase
MITYFHNPNCSKSRDGLRQLSEKKGSLNMELRIVHYLDSPPTQQTLEHLFTHYNGPLSDLIRDPFSDSTDSTIDHVIALLRQYPERMQRPLLVYKNQVILGRPVENITQFINDYLSE